MIKVLIGNIAAGKSTFCKKEAKQGSIIVNDDSIVMAVHGGNYKLYKEELKPLYKAVENQIIISAITLGKDVLIDRALNLQPKARRRFIGLAHSLDTKVSAIIFPFQLPTEHAYRRVTKDDRGLSYETWLEVAHKLNDQYVRPTKEEGFDEIYVYT